ncbi:MAG: N-acetylmuramoyl-L-alanine amidase [Burkholderiales bacterium]|nr:N-acetylmuramoyl-L-alanine amidase [Burkholderiales bacterium]
MRPIELVRRVGLLAVLALAGCASVTPGGVPIDTEYTAVSQDSRVLFLVLHYTAGDFASSLKILTQGPVSAHYLVSDETPPRIYRLVDENRRAWHSGKSAWQDNKRLNSSSIGIEIVNPGTLPGTPDGPPAQRLYAPFRSDQIDVLIPLVKDIVARHQIHPDRILGHGEVSPSYKEDPGPLFPWRRLAELGITPPLPDAARVEAARAAYALQPPDAAWYQRELMTHGYAIENTGVFDDQTQRVLMNFQMRYRPANYAGVPDAETAALLDVINHPLPAPAPAAAASAPPG